MPKKGKKEVEKERQAEEERLRLLEEERIAKEKLEKELAEAKNQEEIDNIIKNDRTRLDEEADEINKLYDIKSTELSIFIDKIAKEIEWKTYLACNYLPNPKIEKDVMSYLSSFAEEPLNIEDQPTLDNIFKLYPNTDLLASQLEAERCALLDEAKSDKALKVGLQITRLREILQQKCDYLTAVILQHIDYFQVEPNENFLISKSTPTHTLGIWGNLTKNPRYKSIDIGDAHMSMSIPKPLSLANVGVRVMFEHGCDALTQFEIQETDCHMSVVGGVLFLDLVELPDLAKVVDKWTIRPILSTEYGLKRIPYPFKKASMDAGEEENKTEESAASVAGQDIFSWTSLIHFHLPRHCVVDKRSAKVMVWNSDLKTWDDENITETDYDADTGKVRFRSIHFAPTALVQNTFGEFPLQEWSLVPLGTNASLLTLKGQLSEITIEIGQGKCRLMKPKIDLKVSGEDAWMAPSLLFKKLSRFGYNFRAPRSLKGVDIEDWILKHPKLEEQVNRGILFCSPCFIFKSCTSNRQVSASKGVFQFKENVENASVQDTDGWKTVVFDVEFPFGDGKMELGFLTLDSNVSNKTKFNAQNSQGFSIRSSVYHLLKNAISDPSSAQKLQEFSALYTQTLVQVLQITRVLCFS